MDKKKQDEVHDRSSKEQPSAPHSTIIVSTMWPFASCSPERASSLEEGLAAAENYDGDPLECPCIQHMKEGPCGDKFVIA